MTSAVSRQPSPSRVVDHPSAFAYPPLVVLAGPPGAGKGTQCSQLAERHGLAHVSIGESLRQEVNAGTLLGSRVRASLAAGQLVRDRDVSDVIAEQLARHRTAPAILLDGYPRTLGQAEMLERLRPDAVGLVVLLVVPLAAVLRRLRGRGRTDDGDADVVAQRMLSYDRDTRPAMAWYASRGLVVHVDGSAPRRDVSANIAGHLTAIGLGTQPGTSFGL